MGTHKTVDDLMKKETEFKEAVEQEQRTMDATMKPFAETFDAFVANFYKGNNWTPIRLGSGFQRDLQSEAEFSLETIAHAIETHSRRRLGRKYPGRREPPRSHALHDYGSNRRESQAGSRQLERPASG